MTTAEKIKAFRLLQGISQKQLADSIHVSQTAVYNWEKGLRIPKLEQLCQISSTYNVSLTDLADALTLKMMGVKHQNGHKKATDLMDYRESDRQERELLLLFNRLNLHGKNKVIDYTQDICNMKKYQAEDLKISDDPAPQEEQTTEDPDNIVTVDLTPNAAHAFNPTEEEKKRTDEIMKDDSFWE